MGDQIGSMVEGSLSYVPRDEFERIRSLPLDSVTSASLFADLCRINSLYMIARAGSGHVGTSFSSIDIIAWIELFELGQSGKDNNDEITNKKNLNIMETCADSIENSVIDLAPDNLVKEDSSADPETLSRSDYGDESDSESDEEDVAPRLTIHY